MTENSKDSVMLFKKILSDFIETIQDNEDNVIDRYYMQEINNCNVDCNQNSLINIVGNLTKCGEESGDIKHRVETCMNTSSYKNYIQEDVHDEKIRKSCLSTSVKRVRCEKCCRYFSSKNSLRIHKRTAQYCRLSYLENRK